MTTYIGRDSRGIRHLVMPTTPNSNGDIFYVTKCTKSYYDTIDLLEDGSPTCLWCMTDALRMTESEAMGVKYAALFAKDMNVMTKGK